MKGEELYTRMRLLEKDNNKILGKYGELKQEQADLDQEFETHKEQSMVQRSKHKAKKLDLANKIKANERQIED